MDVVRADDEIEDAKPPAGFIARWTQGNRAHLPDWPRWQPLELAAPYCGLARSTFLREVKEGRAPKPVYVTPGKPVWDRYDLDAWLEGLKAAEQDAEAPNPWDALAP